MVSALWACRAEFAGCAKSKAEKQAAACKKTAVSKLGQILSYKEENP